MGRIAVLAVAVLACSKSSVPSPPPPPAPPPVAPVAPAAPASCLRDVGQVQAARGAPSAPMRPTHTFSIVARDPVTGDLGVAVQSHWFAVGAGVTWAEPGVGAIATQSFAEPAYGRKGLERMRAGTSAPDALAALLAEDAKRDVRQVAFVDGKGQVAAHTGAANIAFAGHHTGAGYSVQANMMANDRVVPAMRAAYEGATGDLAERLLATLAAAQAAGGDVRGCQSAAMLIVKGTPSAEPSHDTLVDLRVDDAADPIAELGRLLKLQRVYDHMNAGDGAVERGDVAGAKQHYGAAAAAAPELTEVRYWSAVALASAGDVDAALPMFTKIFAEDSRWIEVTRRIQPAVVPATAEGDAVIQKILTAAPTPR
ncbi:MAG: DUF1028 domain-containing protein [Myxococcales bacterium]|nr:DUF1028 domain-containing protein [Myxococcales bacterium]MBK7192140.1 DUF1028 domain-containing protein [Myxococcales bacterium]